MYDIIKNAFTIYPKTSIYDVANIFWLAYRIFGLYNFTPVQEFPVEETITSRNGQTKRKLVMRQITRIEKNSKAIVKPIDMFTLVLYTIINMIIVAFALTDKSEMTEIKLFNYGHTLFTIVMLLILIITITFNYLNRERLMNIIQEMHKVDEVVSEYFK